MATTNTPTNLQGMARNRTRTHMCTRPCSILIRTTPTFIIGIGIDAAFLDRYANAQSVYPLKDTIFIRKRAK